MSGPDQEFLREPFDLVGYTFCQLELDQGGYGKQGAVATGALLQRRQAEFLKLGSKIDRAWRPTKRGRYGCDGEQTQ